MNCNAYKNILILNCLWLSLILKTQDNEYRFQLMHDLKDYAFFNVQNNQHNNLNTYFSVTQSTNKHTSQASYNAQNLYNAITLATIKTKLTPDQYKEFCRQQYVAFYGVEQPVLQCLLSESLEYVEKWIISNPYLTKEQRLKVWDACCAPKWFKGKQKRNGRMNIEKEFDKQLKKQKKKEEAARALSDKQVQKLEDVKKIQDQKKIDLQNQLENLNREKEQQESKILQKKEDTSQSFESNIIRFTIQKTILQQRLENLGIDSAQYVYLPSDFEMLEQEYLAVENLCDLITLIDESDNWSLRKAALQKTKDENFSQSWQEVDMSDRAKAYLQLHNLKPEMYIHCYGTALQQEINRKNCEILELVVQKQREMLSRTTFLGYAMQCVDASWWANEFEAMLLAAGLQDLGKECCHISDWIMTQISLYGKAVADGVVESAHDFVHMVSHPLDTISSFAQAAYFVTETLALYDPELWLDYTDIFEPLKEQRQQLIGSMLSAGIHSIKDADGPQRVKMATKFVSDCIFQHKALQIVGVVAGVLRTQAGAMRTIEFVNDVIGHEPIYAGAGEKIVQLTEELESVVQKSVAENIATQKSNPVLPVRSKILTLSESVAKVKKYGGKIPMRDIELYHNAKYWVEQINAKVNTKIESVLFEQYGKMSPIIGNPEISVCMDFEHTINPRYQLLKDKSGAFYIVDFKGGHLAGTISKLEKEGLVKIHSSIEFSKGCIEYQVEDLFTGRMFTHTEFPLDWGIEKIAQEVKCLTENAIKNGLFSEKKHVAKIMTEDGLDLKIITNFDPLDHACESIENIVNRHIVTAHPIREIKK